MSFSGDDRAVVVQIGAVLLLGFVVIAMTGYQATVVPDQNREVEFDHSQEVQSQLQDLRNGIVSTADGGSSAHSVSLGTSYPARTLFVNPGPPGGQLRTLGTGEITIENAAATGTEGESVREYWNGTARSLNTTAFAYDPNYNELGNAPTTVYEHSLLYDAHPTGANTTVADQLLVDGDELTVLSLEGDLQRSSAGTVSVDVRSASASGDAVRVTNASDGPIRITVPTRSPDAWSRALPDGAAVVRNETAGGEYTRSTIELAPDEYELRMARARIGDSSGSSVDADANARYLVNVEGDAPVAEVRDGHNNPVAGATVRYEAESGRSGTETAGDDGRVGFDAAAGDRIEAWIHDGRFGDGRAYEEVAIDVATGGGTGGSGGGGAYDVRWRASQSDDAVDCSAYPSCDLYLNRTADVGSFAVATSPRARGANVDYWVEDADGAVEEFDSTGATNADGENETAVRIDASAVSEGDSFALGAWSGGDSDRVDVTVRGVDATPRAPSAAVEAVADRSRDCDRNNGGNCRRGTAPAVEFAVDWSASDPDGDLTDVRVELLYDGAVVDSYSEPIGGEVADASNSTVLRDDSGSGWNDEYAVRVTATDGRGQSGVDERREVADGR